LEDRTISDISEHGSSDLASSITDRSVADYVCYSVHNVVAVLLETK